MSQKQDELMYKAGKHQEKKGNFHKTEQIE